MVQVARKVLLPLERPKTFVERVKHRDNFAVYRTYDVEERPCWFLIKANELNLLKLEHTSYDDIIDLSHYGEVVGSGWGHEPDEHVLKKLTGDNS
jgi:hypothetical protein